MAAPAPSVYAVRMTLADIEATVWAGVPLAAAWRIEVLAAADGAATVRLPADPALLRPGGTVSGPALMGLADIAIWAALLGCGEGDSVTAQQSMVFLRPAGSGPIIANARLVKRGRRLTYAEVWLQAEGADAPCAHATASWVAIG